MWSHRLWTELQWPFFLRLDSPSEKRRRDIAMQAWSAYNQFSATLNKYKERRATRPFVRLVRCAWSGLTASPEIRLRRQWARLRLESNELDPSRSLYPHQVPNSSNRIFGTRILHRSLAQKLDRFSGVLPLKTWNRPSKHPKTYLLYQVSNSNTRQCAFSICFQKRNIQNFNLELFVQKMSISSILGQKCSRCSRYVPGEIIVAWNTFFHYTLLILLMFYCSIYFCSKCSK